MKRCVSLLFVFLLALTFAGSALAQGQGAPKPQLAFVQPLTDVQLIPPPQLGTARLEGESRLVFDHGMRFANLSMRIKDNFSGVTAIHLHLAEAGAGNGVDDIVVTVKEFFPPIRNRSFTVLELIVGAQKVDSVNNIASLYQAVRDGRVYIDVHTEDFPDGEIRGQIFPSR